MFKFDMVSFLNASFFLNVFSFILSSGSNSNKKEFFCQPLVSLRSNSNFKKSISCTSGTGEKSNGVWAELGFELQRGAYNKAPPPGADHQNQ